jgi:hypothetical protein
MTALVSAESLVKRLCEVAKAIGDGKAILDEGLGFIRTADTLLKAASRIEELEGALANEREACAKTLKDVAKEIAAVRAEHNALANKQFHMNDAAEAVETFAKAKAYDHAVTLIMKANKIISGGKL